MILQRLRAAWQAYQRRADLRVLWPVCKDRAPNLEYAKAAFTYHAYHDPAWMPLGRAEITRQIKDLT